MQNRKIMWVPIYDDYAQGWTPVIIDEDKSEIPLNFDEWVQNYGEQELINISLIHK